MSYTYGPHRQYPSHSNGIAKFHDACAEDLAYLAVVAEMVENNKPSSAQLLRLADVLNGKASALLTHVSIMVAAAIAFLLTQKIEPSVKLLLSFDIISYLLATLLSLFAVQITGPDSFQGYDYSTGYRYLVLLVRRRRRAYRLAWWLTFWATVGLIFVVIKEAGVYTLVTTLFT